MIRGPGVLICLLWCGGQEQRLPSRSISKVKSEAVSSCSGVLMHHGVIHAYPMVAVVEARLHAQEGAAAGRPGVAARRVNEHLAFQQDPSMQPVGVDRLGAAPSIMLRR